MLGWQTEQDPGDCWWGPGNQKDWLSGLNAMDFHPSSHFCWRFKFRTEVGQWGQMRPNQLGLTSLPISELLKDGRANSPVALHLTQSKIPALPVTRKPRRTGSPLSCWPRLLCPSSSLCSSTLNFAVRVCQVVSSRDFNTICSALSPNVCMLTPSLLSTLCSNISLIERSPFTTHYDVASQLITIDLYSIYPSLFSS